MSPTTGLLTALISGEGSTYSVDLQRSDDPDIKTQIPISTIKETLTTWLHGERSYTSLVNQTQENTVILPILAELDFINLDEIEHDADEETLEDAYRLTFNIQ